MKTLSTLIILCFGLPILADEVTPLSFDTALTLIMQRSTGIASEQANLGSTEARALPSKLVFLPSLSADAAHTDSNSQGMASTQKQVEGQIQYNLFRFGADFENLKASQQDVKAQEHQVESTWLSVEDEGVQALVGEIQQRRTIDVNQGIVRTRKELFKIAQERYRAGYLAIQEVDKLSVDLTNAEAQLSDAELAEHQARLTLEPLLGRSDIALEWPWSERMASVAGAVAALPAPDLSSRPEVQAAKARIEAEDYRYSQAKRLLLPSLDGSFTYGYYWGPTYGVGGTAGLEGPAWIGTLTVRLPLFDQGVTYSRIENEFYLRTAAEAQLDQIQRQVLAQYNIARESFLKALNSAQARDRTLSLSRRLYEDNLRRFRAGRMTADELSIEQTRLFDSELLSIQGWSQAHVYFAHFCHYMGRRIFQCWALSKGT